jgi:hypothetical protein
MVRVAWLQAWHCFEPVYVGRDEKIVQRILSRFWSGWRPCLQIVQPATVIAWHRRAFAWYWTQKSRRRLGRPEVTTEIRGLIQRMTRANPVWGAHPTEEWTMQQIREAFPWNHAPRYVLRDRDAIYGSEFTAITKGMGMEAVVTAPRAPWQKGYVSHCTS